MRIINKEEFEIEQEQFFEQILKGDVYIHPTDTIYGLGANATNKKSVQKIRKLKKNYSILI